MAIFGIGAVKQIISEDNGNLSSMRILSALIIVIILGNYTYFNIRNGSMGVFDMKDLIAMLGPLGIKMLQKGKEK